MKIKMISMAFTPHGVLEKGAILESGKKYSEEFLNHLINDCGAAERMDSAAYETKIDDSVEVKKKPLSSRSLPPAKVSKKKTANTRKKKAK